MVTVCNLNSIKLSFIKKEFSQIHSVLEQYDEVKNSDKSMNVSKFMSSEGMKETMKKGIMTDEEDGEGKPSMSDVEMDGTEYLKDNILSMIAGQNRKKLKNAGHQFEELVFRCSWSGFTCNEG